MKNAHAGLLTGLLVCLVSSAMAFPAHADGPPPADAMNLTPPEAPLTPTPSVPSSSAELTQSSQPVEFLSGPHPSKLAAYIFAGAAVVGVGVGTAFGILALNNQSNYNTTPTSNSLASANQDAVIADVAVGAAVIAGVTSVVLFLKKDDAAPTTAGASNHSSSPSPSRRANPVSFTVAPIVTPHGAGAGVVLRF